MTCQRITAVLCAMVFAGCAAGNRRPAIPDGSSGVINYVDARHGVRLVYPADWEEKSFLFQPKSVVLMLMPPSKVGMGKLPPTVSLVVQEPRQPLLSSDLPAMEQRIVEKGRKEIEQFTIVESADATLGGEPARRIVYTGRKLGVSVQVMYVIAVQGGKGWAVSYAADPGVFEEQRPAVQQVVDSLEFAR